MNTPPGRRRALPSVRNSRVQSTTEPATSIGRAANGKLDYKKLRSDAVESHG